MPTYRKIPQELWDKVTSYLPLSGSDASKIFKFELRTPAYDRAWDAVFKSEHWAESAGAEHANIVLIGADLDLFSNSENPSARPHLLLTAFEDTGDLQCEENLLSSSLRGVYKGHGENQLERLTLTIGKFDVSEIIGKDFRYLFFENKLEIGTKYCYWNDPKKRIRIVEPHDILGIDGPITETANLAPIFLLNLYPPVRDMLGYFKPHVLEQFIFRNFGGESFMDGKPPLVDVIQGDKTCNGDFTFMGFKFKNNKYKSYPRQGTDWNKEAAREDF
jgi:hypothetical protein